MESSKIEIWAPTLPTTTGRRVSRISTRDMALPSSVHRVRVGRISRPLATIALNKSLFPRANRVSDEFDVDFGQDEQMAPSKSQGVINRLRAYQVDMNELANNLKITLSDFQKVMDDLPQTAKGYCIDEIELNMGVNGKGGIVLIGKMEVGIEAAIKVKIKREVETKPESKTR